MAKRGSVHSGKSTKGSSSLHSRGAKTRSASSHSERRTRRKRENSVSISVEKARGTPINWATVDATSEADIERHAREDGTRTPSDRKWRSMLKAGHVRAVAPGQVDVRAIRAKLKLSQSEFAARFGFTAAAVRQWEQGRRYPHGPARVLLTIIEREPNAVRRALERASSS